MARSRKGTQAASDIPKQRNAQRQELDALQQAAPLAASPNGSPAGAPSPNVFGPSQRPDEPITAGANLGPGQSPGTVSVLPEDPDQLIRAIYAMYPHPEILRLLNDA